MPGQGYHLGVLKVFCDTNKKEMSDEFLLGALVPDALNGMMGGRRVSHFCGGAGCIIPRLGELKELSKESISKWDTAEEASYIVDPEIDLWGAIRMAGEHSQEGYRLGLICHYVADYVYDKYIRCLFDFSHQSDGYVTSWLTGERISGADFRKEVYAFYPALDQMAYAMSGFSQGDVERARTLVRERLPEAQAEFLCQYLHDVQEMEWPESRFFVQRDFQIVFRRSVKFQGILQRH